MNKDAWNAIKEFWTEFVPTVLLTILPFAFIAVGLLVALLYLIAYLFS